MLVPVNRQRCIQGQLYKEQYFARERAHGQIILKTTDLDNVAKKAHKVANLYRDKKNSFNLKE